MPAPPGARKGAWAASGPDCGPVRLFSCVQPPEHVARALQQLPRPDLPELRWTRAEQWHVTLHFYGEVGAGELPALGRALAAAGRSVVGPVIAELGTWPLVLGNALGVPVLGLDSLASAVREATAGFGRRPEPRTFRAHVTLARARGSKRAAGRLAGRLPRWAPEGTVRWEVEELLLVSSALGPAGARHDTVARLPVGGGNGSEGPRTNMRSSLEWSRPTEAPDTPGL